MLDNKGTLYILDAIFAIIMVLSAFLIVNSTLTLETPEYFYESHDIITAQDIMELLGGKIDFGDESFLSVISHKLEKGENSKESIRQVSTISKDKLKSYGLNHYQFSEENVLDGEVLANSGDLHNAQNVSVASRDYGEYSYSLKVW